MMNIVVYKTEETFNISKLTYPYLISWELLFNKSLLIGFSQSF